MQKKQNKKQKRISPNTIAALGAFIILIGGFFLSYNYIQSKQVMAYDYMSNIFYNNNNQKTESNEETSEENKEKDKVEEKEGETEKTNTVTNEYIGYLNIPKINLNKGFLDKNSEENNVDKNIMVIQESSYPDVDKGNLIIAGHSGPNWNAYFNDLHKLQIGDTATVQYKNKKYNYKIVNIYKQKNVGTIAIYRDYNKTTLTLVTCTNDDYSTQTIYIAELQDVANN